jgi:hypothetical protein
MSDTINTIPVIKRPVGRPRLSPEERERRLEKYREQNKQTQRLLRERNPELCSEYRKKYYMEHSAQVKEKLNEMKTVYTLWKEGKLIMSETPLSHM